MAIRRRARGRSSHTIAPTAERPANSRTPSSSSGARHERTWGTGSLDTSRGGRYLEQLETVLDHYPRGQLLVVLTEDLRDEPVDTFRRICDFVRSRWPRTT